MRRHVVIVKVLVGEIGLHAAVGEKRKEVALQGKTNQTTACPSKPNVRRLELCAEALEAFRRSVHGEREVRYNISRLVAKTQRTDDHRPSCEHGVPAVGGRVGQSRTSRARRWRRCGLCAAPAATAARQRCCAGGGGVVTCPTALPLRAAHP